MHGLTPPHVQAQLHQYSDALCPFGLSCMLVAFASMAARPYPLSQGPGLAAWYASSNMLHILAFVAEEGSKKQHTNR